MKTKTKIIIFTVTFFACIIATFFIISKNNKVEALSKYGSRGSEVTQIQTTQTQIMPMQIKTQAHTIIQTQIYQKQV